MKDQGGIIMEGVLLEEFLFRMVEKVFDFLIALKRVQKDKNRVDFIDLCLIFFQCIRIS